MDFNQIYSTLQKANYKDQLDLCFKESLNLIKSGNILKENLNKLGNLFRNKIYEIIFSQGDITESIYICMYGLIDGNLDKRFETFIKIADENLFLNNTSDEENIMLLELGSIARILAGKKEEGIKHYIKNISLIDMNIASAEKRATLILESFKFLKIPFELFLSAMKEILNKSYMLSLSPIKRRSVFNWQLHVFWNIEHFFNHRDWLTLYPFWKDIFYSMLQETESKKIEEALYIQFFIYHMCGNSFISQEQWRDFNHDITQKACIVYEKFGTNFHLSKPTFKQKDKKIIGFLRDRLVENSPYKVEYSFLKNILENEEFKQKYEIRLYIMSILEKSQDDLYIKQSYEKLGVKIIDVVSIHNQKLYYNSHLDKALSIREKIIQDNVDILISPNNGYGISDFILSNRSALKQIFWSHGNFVYDIPQIDKKITHISGNSPSITHEGFEFIGVSVNMDKAFYNPSLNPEVIQKYRKIYPSDKIILGVIGRLTKIDSLCYLETIIKILQTNPKTIFMACGNGNVYEIKQKIDSIDKNMLDRFIFPGYVDSAIYGHIIDIWLDSFPMEQGESKIEFNAKGKPIISLSKESQTERKNRLQDWFKQNSINLKEESQKEGISLEYLETLWIEDINCIAFDESDYIQKANTLINLSQQELKKICDNRMLLRKIYDNIRKKAGIKSFLKAIE